MGVKFIKIKEKNNTLLIFCFYILFGEILYSIFIFFKTLQITVSMFFDTKMFRILSLIFILRPHTNFFAVFLTRTNFIKLFDEFTSLINKLERLKKY